MKYSINLPARHHLLWIAAGFLGMSPGDARASEDIIVNDFEAADFGGWKTSGEAFGMGPAAGPVGVQMGVDGFSGKGYCSSFHGGDDATGTLASPPFRVERKHLNFLIGGGGFARKTCINLLSGGKVVKTATGPNTMPGGSERLAWQSWDVGDLKGAEVTLEIVDQAKDGWGHVSIDRIMQSDTPPPTPEEQYIREAGAIVESKAAIAATDPLRPIYHVMSKSQSIGDPNGPVYFNGEYHVFYQHFPGKPGIVWGHAVSKDMVRWEHLPIALAPGLKYDIAGIASGGCVIDGNVPTIIYTGFNGPGRQQTQCVATSDDNLRTWTKERSNPVLATQPPLGGLDRDGFRDPFVWREGNEWRLLVGSGYAKEKGGTVLLYRSKDLRKWDFIGPLSEGMGEQCFMWECPTFFPLGDKHVLIVSPLFRNVPGLRGFTQYAVGTYRNNRFVPESWKPVDLGGPGVFYAATTFADPKNRRILWSFIITGGRSGWSNCLALPRLVSLGKDSTMLQAPLPELSGLRKRERDCGNRELAKDGEVILDDNAGLHVEAAVEIDMKSAAKIELRIGRAADGSGYVPLSYDKTTGSLVFGDKKGELKLGADEMLRVRLFTDGVVAEAFVNEKISFTNTMPVTEKSVGLSIVATGGDARLVRGKLWEMSSIW